MLNTCLNIQEQQHLDMQDTVNYGSYYTPKEIVDIVYSMLARHLGNFTNYKIIDTSCGYGSFLNMPNVIGADIDIKSLEIAKNKYPNATFFNHNSLKDVHRNQYLLSERDSLIIVGNPPYNDTTSFVKNEIKQSPFPVDVDLKARDLGMSFLLSYDKLDANIICVLHPLSYLIKKSNFAALKTFKKHYKLIDSLIISSHEFSATSKATPFPIVIALYKKSDSGMDYHFIRNYSFKTKEGKTWNLAQFDDISHYIQKYPNQKSVSLEETTAFFWTIRDINALKRTRSFIAKESLQTIRVTQEKFAYYCYVDIFKSYIQHIPYYFGNNEIIINHEAFLKIKNAFLDLSLNKHSFLSSSEKTYLPEKESSILVDIYFKELLGEHYVD